MASGYSSVDSDSNRRSCSGGSRSRTRRRGTYFPRQSKNISPDYRYANQDTARVTLRDLVEPSNRDVNSLSSRNEEITGRPRDRFNEVREKYRYGQHTLFTGNSEDFHSERDREERRQGSLGHVFSFDKHHRGRQHASGRANNSLFWEDDSWHDKNETITQKFYSHRGRGGRGRTRVGGRKVFASHSNTEENPVQLDWREGMTNTSKAVDALYDYRILCCFCRNSELAERKTQ